MINELHKLFHDPNRGWDPVGPDYAARYAAAQSVDRRVAVEFSAAVGGLSGKRILDLGSGAGQYGADFALAGAEKTCLDISRAYLAQARQRGEAMGASLEYVLGYLEDCDRLTSGGYDGIFCNICWYYGVSDRALAGSIARSLAVGGILYVRTSTGLYGQPASPLPLKRVLYDRFNWKIGHPYPPSGMVARACARAGLSIVETRNDPDGIELTIARRTR